MILDAESPPKSPVSSGPTVRSPSGPSAGRPPVSYATFPETSRATQYENDVGSSETRPLLYQTVPQSLYDDIEPPAYDEISTLPKGSAPRNRFWTRWATFFLVVFLICSTFYSYDFTKTRQPVRSPPSEPREPPPATPTDSRPPALPSPPSKPSPPPSPSLPPLPPGSSFPDLPTRPFVLPIKGRVDLCRPWAYSSKPGVRPSYSDNRPIDKLVYAVPSLAPIHLETSAICLTSNGTSEICEDYDDTYDSIAGKLQVVGAEIELPQIEVTIQHGSETGLDNTAVCLMNKPDGNGKDRWVLGLYAWRDPSTDDRDALLISMSIVVTLPRSQVHDLSTRLNYFAQTIGPENKTSTNALTFDTLEARLGERGSLSIRNVTVAALNTRAFGDTQQILDTRVTESAQIQSDTGLILCQVTLVQTESTPPVRLDIQSEVGTISSVATLEYPSTPSFLPQFDIKVFSHFSPAMAFVKDPRGTSLLRQKPGLVPDILPIIRVNSTSRLSIGQAVLPPTFHGHLTLNSKHAGVVAIDHAKDLPGRTTSWDHPTSTGYRGTVQWAGREKQKEVGFVSAMTEYASARLLFLGLDDDDITDWPESTEEIHLERLQ